ncbi:MAG: DUF503 domain-containing protein [Chloroflexota bacterium]|nr:MAG: DUF503 domain-containing protein [Chloroflexota bacterium]
MSLGLLRLHLHLAGCTSLKEKRRRLKPLISRLHREFNISVAEMDFQDSWQEALIACALISNDNGHTQRCLLEVVRWIETSWPDVTLVDDHLEIY